MSARWLAALLGLVAALLATGVLSREPPSWNDGVGRVVAERCGECHLPGGVAPFSLLRYDQARPWAKAIAREVEAGAMPPWHAEPGIGVFSNDRSLAPAERELLLAWVEGGALEGDPAEAGGPEMAPSTEAVSTSEWRIGEPDLVLTLPEVVVPAQGEVPYHDYVLDPGLEEEVWIQATEVKPGDPAVVHHVIVEYVVENPRVRARLREAGLEGRVQGSLGGYVPGDGPLVMPDGFGRLLPAGARLYFQVHYTPVGTEQADRTRLGLRFSEQPPRFETRTGLVSSPFIHIPPGAADVRLEADYRFERDAMLLSMRPHLHLRGKSFEYRAQYPDGREEVLLRIPRWDFDWQTTYHLAEPKSMPAGTRLVAVGSWDNSADNPRNPDPGVTVGWGQRTVDEMMIGFFDYYER